MADSDPGHRDARAGRVRQHDKLLRGAARAFIVSSYGLQVAQAQAGLGSDAAAAESAIDVKAARRRSGFAELQRRAPMRAPRARKRAINLFDITPSPPWRLTRIAAVQARPIMAATRPQTVDCDRSEPTTILVANLRRRLRFAYGP